LLLSGRYGSALAAAACKGKIEIIKFLIENGAEANLLLPSGDYGSALAAASYWGWKGCVESFLDAGAKVNIRLENGRYRTALQASRADISRRMERMCGGIGGMQRA
jgi:ankyrin repeat protein